MIMDSDPAPRRHLIVRHMLTTVLLTWLAVADAEAADSFTISGSRGRVHTVAVSTDGNWIATAGATTSGEAHAPGYLLVWDAKQSHVHMFVDAHQGQVYDVAFTPDGAIMATGAARGKNPSDFEKAQNLKLWDTKTGRQLATLVGQKEGVTCLAFSPDGKTLVSGSLDGTVCVRRGFQQQLYQLKHAVISLDHSPDGKLLAIGCVNGHVEIWDAASCNRTRELRVHEREDVGVTVGFSPNGSLLSTASPGRLRLYDTVTLKIARTFTLNQKVMPVFSFSPDSKQLAVTAGSEGQPTTIKVWDLDSKMLVASLQHDVRVSALSFFPEKSKLVSGGTDGSVRVWRLSDSPSERRATPADRRKTDISPFRNKIVFFGSQHPTHNTSLIQSMNPDGTDLTTLLELNEEGYRGIVGGRVSPNAKRIAFGVLRKRKDTSQYETWVMDAQRKHEVVATDGFPVAWSPDGKQLLLMEGKTHDWKHSIVDIATKQSQPLGLAPTSFFSDWSAKGNVFAVVLGNQDRLFELRPNDYYPRRQVAVAQREKPNEPLWKTDENLDCIDARFAPNGSQLAHYARKYQNQKPIETGVVVDANGKRRRELWVFTQLSDDWIVRPHGSPCWSPDGKQIVWQVGKRRVGSQEAWHHNPELIFDNVDGTEPRRMPLNQKGIPFWGSIDWR